jgi:FF domain
VVRIMLLFYITINTRLLQLNDYPLSILFSCWFLFLFPLLSHFHPTVLFLSYFCSVIFSWTVPEEYRVWKEKMDAVESKKLLALQAASLAQKSSSSSSKFTNSSSKSENDNNGHSSGKRKGIEIDDRPAPSYASQAEATEAFKSMLADKKILTTMKMKEVTDLCQNDVRFRALRSAGERKQALAEYQVGRGSRGRGRVALCGI